MYCHLLVGCQTTPADRRLTAIAIGEHSLSLVAVVVCVAVHVWQTALVTGDNADHFSSDHHYDNGCDDDCCDTTGGKCNSFC